MGGTLWFNGWDTYGLNGWGSYAAVSFENMLPGMYMSTLVEELVMCQGMYMSSLVEELVMCQECI